MKQLGFLLMASLLLAGCQYLSSETGRLVHTGCAAGTEVATRSHSGGIDREEIIRLKYSTAGLVVTDEWGDYNCAIKHSDMQVKLDIRDSDIYLSFWVEPLANCICPVKEVKYVVGGLTLGKEYTLHFNGLGPIQFKYSTLLNLKLKADDYVQYY